MALATGQQQVAAAHPAAPRARPPGEVEEILLRPTDGSDSLSSPNDLSGERIESSSPSLVEFDAPKQLPTKYVMESCIVAFA